MESDGYKQTKVEKTGDKTFNIHNERGDVFECNSPEKLGNLKDVTHMKADAVTSTGMGEKRGLICGKCSKIVVSVHGVYDKILKKMNYHCNDCNQ